MCLVATVVAALLAVSTAGAHHGGGRIAAQATGSQEWATLSPSPQARTEVAGAAVGGSIFVVGGYGPGGAPSTATTRYDTATDRWSLARPLPASVNHTAAVSYRGSLYVVGGYKGAPFSLGIGTGGVADATAAFWRYDPGSDSWTAMPSAPSERGAAAAAVIGDELFVAGGADALRPLRTVEIFDFRTGRWRRGPDLPLATEHTAGTAVAGAFYVLGGRPFYGGGTHRFAQRYDPVKDRWTRVADLQAGHAGLAAVTACGRPVALGGEDPGSSPAGTVPLVEIYEPRSDRWERLPDMRTPRHGFGGAAVGDEIFALEGGPVTFLSVTNVAEALKVDCASSGGPNQLGRSPGAGSEPTPPDDRKGDRARRKSRAVAAPQARAGRPSTSALRPPADVPGTDAIPYTGFALAPPLITGVGLLVLGAALRLATRRTARRSPRRSSRRPRCA